MSKSKTKRKTSRKSSSSRSAKSSKKTQEITSLSLLTKKTDRTQYPSNTWVVFRSSSERKPMLFERTLSRDQVRSAYSRITGTKHDDTRSRRLSNY